MGMYKTALQWAGAGNGMVKVAYPGSGWAAGAGSFYGGMGDTVGQMRADDRWRQRQQQRAARKRPQYEVTINPTMFQPSQAGSRPYVPLNQVSPARPLPAPSPAPRPQPQMEAAIDPQMFAPVRGPAPAARPAAQGAAGMQQAGASRPQQNQPPRSTGGWNQTAPAWARNVPGSQPTRPGYTANAGSRQTAPQPPAAAQQAQAPRPMVTQAPAQQPAGPKPVPMVTRAPDPNAPKPVEARDPYHYARMQSARRKAEGVQVRTLGGEQISRHADKRRPNFAWEYTKSVAGDAGNAALQTGRALGQLASSRWNFAGRVGNGMFNAGKSLWNKWF